MGAFFFLVGCFGMVWLERERCVRPSASSRRVLVWDEGWGNKWGGTFGGRFIHGRRVGVVWGGGNRRRIKWRRAEALKEGLNSNPTSPGLKLYRSLTLIYTEIFLLPSRGLLT